MNVLIVAAGEKPSGSLFLRHFERADFTIAVDGGLAVFGAHMPGLIVGDMDSVDAALLAQYEAQGVPVLKVAAEKNETDSMLAVDEAVRRGAKEIIMLGATGLRLDHTLSNLALLKRAREKNVQMVIEDGRQTIFIGRGAFEISGAAGQTVSLLPVDSRARVSAKGLKYPLEDLLLTNDITRGVSNVLCMAKAEVCTQQPVFVILNKVDV